MPVVITCASCSTKLRVAEEHQGKSVRCPRCKKSIPVPAAPPEVTADDTLETELPLVPAGADPFENVAVSPHIQKKFTDEQEEDEQVIWVGQPILEAWSGRPWMMFTIAAVLGGIALAVLILLLALSLGVGMPWYGTVMMGLFVFFFLLGAGAMAAQGFFYDWFAARRPCYLLTDRRVMGFAENQLKSAPAALIPKMRRQNLKKIPGAGNLLVAVKSSGFDANLKLEMLADVDAVERLIKDVLLDGKRPA